MRSVREEVADIFDLPLSQKMIQRGDEALSDSSGAGKVFAQ
jgi:hypothetical protein